MTKLNFKEKKRDSVFCSDFIKVLNKLMAIEQIEDLNEIEMRKEEKIRLKALWNTAVELKIYQL